MYVCRIQKTPTYIVYLNTFTRSDDNKLTRKCWADFFVGFLFFSFSLTPTQWSLIDWSQSICIYCIQIGSIVTSSITLFLLVLFIVTVYARLALLLQTVALLLWIRVWAFLTNLDGWFRTSFFTFGSNERKPTLFAHLNASWLSSNSLDRYASSWLQFHLGRSFVLRTLSYSNKVWIKYKVTFAFYRLCLLQAHEFGIFHTGFLCLLVNVISNF